MRIIIVATAAALVAGCGNSANEKAQTEASAAALQAGEYALTWTDIEKGATANKASAGAADGRTIASSDFPERACIAAGGAIDPAAFGNKKDQCRVVTSYVREGTINVQVECTREGKGDVSQIASGSFSAADSFDAEVETSTSFTGGGNYTMTRKLSAKRVGECTAKQS